MNSLARVRTDLLCHPLDGQVLVYDTRVDRVHLLDATTGCVMQLLQEGVDDQNELQREATIRLGVECTPDLLALAMEELRQADLLEPQSAASQPKFVRREVVRRLAAAGIAGVLVPTVATLTASRAYAQGTLLGVGSACTTNGQCIENRCCGGSCRNASCTPRNGACGAGVDPAKNTTVVDCTCCSGTCTQNGNSPDACD